MPKLGRRRLQPLEPLFYGGSKRFSAKKFEKGPFFCGFRFTTAAKSRIIELTEELKNISATFCFICFGRGRCEFSFDFNSSIRRIEWPKQKE